jgi:hypothetical protein
LRLEQSQEIDGNLDMTLLVRPFATPVRHALAAVAVAALPQIAFADADLAKQLANPIASMTSVPLQFNYDTGLGPNDTDRWITNIQPVTPFSLGDDWNLISRTILPVISLDAPATGLDDVTGIGDVVQSFFFSPKALTDSGWTWGAGPVLSIPTGSDEFTADQWGIGPTFVALKQENGWTYGALANHVWGIDPPDDRDAINNTFLQPFLAYTTPDAWTFTLLSESAYDWNEEQWTVPIIGAVSKLVTVGGQPISLQLGGRLYVEGPEGGPDWGLRAAVTFLFPK